MLSNSAWYCNLRLTYLNDMAKLGICYGMKSNCSLEASTVILKILRRCFLLRVLNLAMIAKVIFCLNLIVGRLKG